MTAFFAHFGFEFRTGIRNKTLLFLNYLFPLMFFLLMGFIMPGINPTFLEGFIAAMVTFAVLAATLLGPPDSLVNAREAGIFRSFKINGIPASSILGVPALSNLLHLSVVAAFITIVSPLLFDAQLPENWVAFIGTFLLLAFASGGQGVLIGVIAPNSRITVVLSQLIFIPSMLLGGLMIPYSMLPEAAQRVSRLFPATHAMNLFRGPAMGLPAEYSATLAAAVLLAVGLLAFGLALYLYTWDARNSERRASPALAVLSLIPLVISMFLV
ncbi:MAG: ABC transporter permease [Chloroflexota bacterium]|nr:ABC transporter permease [Chloroflexota bacterium]